MRLILLCGAVLALAACQQRLPDSGPAGRDIQLEGGVRVPQTILPPEEAVIISGPNGGTPLPAPTTTNTVRGEAADVAAQTRAILGAPPANDPQPVGAPAPLPTAAQPPATNNAGISTEQDFGVVSAERSIEQDAERLRQLRAQGGVEAVDPNDVNLQRPGRAGPNVVEYALQRARPVGNPGYPRGAFASQRSAAQKCLAYRDADAAQEAFLERGGPQTDRLGLDPDGDGNACRWDPNSYRSIVQGG